jgi:NADH-quinone oxidoreductase subunit A
MDQVQYLSEFGEILLFVIAGAIFVLVTLLVSRLIRPNRPSAQKLSTYESGEEPQGLAWVQFNLRFYVLALIFLLFEAEIIFLFPWATVFAKKELLEQTNGAWGWFSLIEMIIFILILALGLAYAWVNGHLDWVKPKPKPTEYTSPVPKSFYESINQKFSGQQKPKDNTLL